MNFKDPQKKNITGNINVFDYNDVKKKVKEQAIVFDYDKQKRIAFANISLPALQQSECTGWFILKVTKEEKDSLDVTFRTNKDCMKADIVISRTN